MPCFVRICLCLAGFFLFVMPALAQFPPDMVWSYSQYNDPGNKGRMTSTIVIGVPETDHVVGRADCFAGSTAGLPVLELAAETRNAAQGAVTGIEFFADAGPIFFEGTVKAPLSEEDYPGVRIRPDMADPIWQVLMRMATMTYRVNGIDIKIPLNGSRQAISAFLSDCAAYHGQFNPNSNAQGGVDQGGQQPVIPANQPFDPRWATCDQLANEVSRNSDVPVRMTFINRSEGFRAVYWIGFDGQPREYAALNPGERFSIDTYMTHPWMFTDGPGNCIEMFMPQPGVSVFNITAPNRDFGPE